ncbi:hypothetical protein [Bradyrhizobium oligotrophicum]|uniref:hypothetical protein n=1 Tax=Bradyrhizobium oligotrophicum TaxID=44255 RepID=UPI0003491326
MSFVVGDRGRRPEADVALEIADISIVRLVSGCIGNIFMMGGRPNSFSSTFPRVRVAGSIEPRSAWWALSIGTVTKTPRPSRSDRW